MTFGPLSTPRKFAFPELSTSHAQSAVSPEPKVVCAKFPNVVKPLSLKSTTAGVSVKAIVLADMAPK